MRITAGAAVLLAASIAVSATVVAGLLVLGAPAEQRQQRLDELRAQDLERLERAIRSYASLHDRLPGDLASLARDNAILKIRDPQTGEAYGYEVLDLDRYRLCATFRSPGSPTGASGLGDASFEHGTGRTCFERRVRSAGETNRER